MGFDQSLIEALAVRIARRTFERQLVTAAPNNASYESSNPSLRIVGMSNVSLTL